MNTRQQAPVDAVGNQKMKDFDSWDNKHRHRGTMAGGTHACEGKTSIIAHQTYLDHGTRVTRAGTMNSSDFAQSVGAGVTSVSNTPVMQCVVLV